GEASMLVVRRTAVALLTPIFATNGADTYGGEKTTTNPRAAKLGAESPSLAPRQPSLGIPPHD
ncbi:MAG: hypothetical protein LC749_19420, partial [Actinobacteria bacterium]|nr:hypothetical protein [Actinomycetota bacterium]